MHVTPSLFAILASTGCLLAQGTPGPSAANLILPSAYATRWGEIANAHVFGSGPMRYQQVHLGTEIAAPTVMFSMGFREDESGYAADGGTVQVRIKLGLTSFDHTTIGLTSSFDANFDSGAPTTVFQGTVSLPALTGRNTNFTTFAAQFPFHAPYIHFPQPGKHLLWEVLTTSTTHTGFFDKVHKPTAGGTVTRLYALNPTATNATDGWRNEGLVVCFGTSAGCTLAAFSTFGSSCAGSSGQPQHGAAGVPRLGGTWSLTLSGARPGPAWLFLDTQRNAWEGIPLPLDLGPFGAPGCTLLVPGTVALAVTVSATGSALVPMQVPASASYCGVSLYTQFVIADPIHNLGFVLSNAGDSRVGN